MVVGFRRGVRRTRFGHLTSTTDLLIRRNAIGGIELVEDVAVDIERHGRRVTCLASDIDDMPTFLDEKRDEPVPEVVGPHAS